MIYKIKITDSVSHEISKEEFDELWEKCVQAKERINVGVDIINPNDIHLIIFSWSGVQDV